MRWLVVLFLLAAAPASAQIAGFPPGTFDNMAARAPAPVTFTGLGDIYGGASYYISSALPYTAAYAAAGGLAFNVRRASDNHTCDFSFLASGALGLSSNCSTPGDDGSTYAAFGCNVGLSSCFFTELYDQTGNGVNFVQATSGNQPIALKASACPNGVGPCIDTNGSTAYMVSSGTTSYAQPVFILASAQDTAFASTYIVAGTAPSIILQFADPVGTNASINAGGTAIALSYVHNSLSCLMGSVNGSSSFMRVNATESSTASIGANTFKLPAGLASDPGGGNLLNGTINVLAMWPSTPDSSTRTSLYNNLHGAGLC